jgi:predicted permease
MDTVSMVGDASTTVILLILGAHLAATDVRAVGRSVAPTVLKLAVAPVVGVVLALGLGFADLTVAKVFVLECVTPAAVIPLSLTIEYAGEVAVEGATSRPRSTSRRPSSRPPSWAWSC